MEGGAEFDTSLPAPRSPTSATAARSRQRGSPRFRRRIHSLNLSASPVRVFVHSSAPTAAQLTPVQQIEAKDADSEEDGWVTAEDEDGDGDCNAAAEESALMMDSPPSSAASSSKRNPADGLATSPQGHSASASPSWLLQSPMGTTITSENGQETFI